MQSWIRWFFSPVLTLCACWSQNCCAISLSENGPVATLYGKIEPGDDDVFREFLGRPRPEPLKVVYLNSRGGLVSAGISIAKQIRDAKLSTAVDALSVTCDSACTLVFAGGVQRYYVGGDKVFEGFSFMSGLGFHTAHYKGDGTTRNSKSDIGTENMRQLFREMGQPGAIDLMDQAAFNSLYRPCGQTALNLHIATSLSAPPL